MTAPVICLLSRTCRQRQSECARLLSFSVPQQKERHSSHLADTHASGSGCVHTMVFSPGTRSCESSLGKAAVLPRVSTARPWGSHLFLFALWRARHVSGSSGSEASPPFSLPSLKYEAEFSQRAPPRLVEKSLFMSTFLIGE